jgi:vitamin B12 transporter
VVAAGGTFRQRQNVDAVKVRGVEMSAGWARGPWSLRAGASLTHARMQASGAASALAGLRPAQTPNSVATLAASWEQGGKGVEVALHRDGAEYEDDLNTRRLKGATTLDAFASLPLTRRLQLVARGENVTNALVVAGVGGDGAIERATPRTLWIGLRLR